MDDAKATAKAWEECSDEVAEWAETAGYENLKGRLAVSDLVSTQAATTLAVLLAGVGGSLAYAVKVFDPGPTAALVWAAAAVCVYLMILCALLMGFCIALVETDLAYNEPRHLMVPRQPLERLRRIELVNIQVRIDEVYVRNQARSEALDRIRWAAVFTPLVFGVAMLVVRGAMHQL